MVRPLSIDPKTYGRTSGRKRGQVGLGRRQALPCLLLQTVGSVHYRSNLAQEAAATDAKRISQHESHFPGPGITVANEALGHWTVSLAGIFRGLTGYLCKLSTEADSIMTGEGAECDRFTNSSPVRWRRDVSGNVQSAPRGPIAPGAGEPLELGKHRAAARYPWGIPMITSFSHIYHRVRDLDESIDFYTNRFGFYLLRRYSIDGRESAYIGLADVLLELTVARDISELPGPAGERRLGLTVTDLDTVMEDLRRAGVEVVQEPYEARTFWGRQAAIKDPNNYIISLREWRDPDNPRFPDWKPNSEGAVRMPEDACGLAVFVAGRCSTFERPRRRAHMPPGTALNPCRALSLSRLRRRAMLAGVMTGHPNNLPLQLSSLVGRAREIEALRGLLLDDGARIVTLTGPGGEAVRRDLPSKLRLPCFRTLSMACSWSHWRRSATPASSLPV